MRLGNVVTPLVRIMDASSLKREERGFPKLTDALENTWDRLLKKRPEVVDALSQNPQSELGEKVFLRLAGVAEVLDTIGCELHAALQSVDTRSELTDSVAKGLITRTDDLRDEVIREGFTELILPPRIDVADIKDEHLGYGRQMLRTYIDVNPEVMMSPRDVLKGGLAHETAHIVNDNRLSRKARALDDKKYEESKSYAKEKERDTDLSVVQRGLGKYLLAFLDWLDAQGYKAHAGGGLKRKEIRQMLGES